jgi:hypothetical protein
MRVAIAVLSVAALAGCSGGPYSEQEKEVKSEVVRRFAELNAEAGARIQAARGTKTDIDVPATSLVVDQYDWDVAGSVYTNVSCGSCQAKLGTRLSTPFRSDLKCPSCGQDLKEALASKALPMFEIRSGTSLPIVVLVRYVRHTSALDPNSAVMVSTKTEATNPIKPYTDAEQRGHGAYYAGGLYRVTSTSLCTEGFVYKGGELRGIDPESVRKMMKDASEAVPVSSMKLGRWGAVEEPMTPWLGRAPSGTAVKEAPKSP